MKQTFPVYLKSWRAIFFGFILALSIPAQGLSVSSDIKSLLEDANSAGKEKDYAREGELYRQAARYFFDVEDYKEAQGYTNKSIKALKKGGFELQLMYSQILQGDIFDKLGKERKAIREYEDAKNLAIKFGKNDELLVCYIKLAQIHGRMGNVAEQEEYTLLVETFDESKMTGNLKKELGSVIQDLKGTRHKLQGTREELESAKDTIQVAQKKNTEQAEQIVLLDAVNEAKEADLRASRAELKSERTLNTALISGIALVALFTILVIRGYRIQKHQNKIIVEQKKGITDSIDYAKGLQAAMLPQEQLIRSHLPDSFVLYKPKDVISGDFYWFEQKGNMVFFAVADCTGHGVPGAMVSMVCSNALRQAVNEYYITDTGKILDKARELVKLSFEHAEESVKDGMDIALCMLEKDTLKLHFAGANNPLWIIRKDAEDVDEFKGDKQPVGNYENETPFSTVTIQLYEGDCIYLFSDGYADQFGGEQGKKFKYKPLKRKLIELYKKESSHQLIELASNFEDWKKGYEQIDDVCIMGIRVRNIQPSSHTETVDMRSSFLRHHQN